MDEKLKSFLEKNKELIRENKWWDLYDKASDDGTITTNLANFLYEGLGQEIMLDLFAKEGKIPTWAFYRCSSLESVTIPNSVKTIGDWAFYGCESLTSIIIPKSVTSIGYELFSRCSSLTSIEFDKPSSLTTIGGSAFRGCSGLTSITIPDSVTSIGYRAFYGCTCHIIFECDKKVVTKNALAGFNGTYEFR